MKGYKVKRTEGQIDEVLNICVDREASGEPSLWHMTYEQGVEAGIKWLIGQTDDNPVVEED